MAGIIFVGLLWLEQSSLYYPHKAVYQTPADRSIAYSEVFFTTTDGQILNGWWVPAPDARFTVLYCHGNAGNIANRLHKVKFFHELGVNFFIFDYRGYGKSTGWPREQGLYRDAMAAYDYLITRPGVDKTKIVFYGKSLGAAVAIDLATRRPAAALVVESGFASAALRGQELLPFLPVQWLMRQRFDSLKKIKGVTIPKLIVHGRQDEVIGFHHGRMLFDAAPQPKQFLAIEATHNDDTFVTSPAYHKILSEFLAGLDSKIK